jgi:long-chain acyl-CoA synthetase
MNLFSRIQLARDLRVTVANLVDELVRRKGDCEVSVGDDGPFRLAELHADIRAIDAFLRRAIQLRPGQPVAIYRSNNRQ